MAEWSIAPACKAGGRKTRSGSNPLVLSTLTQFRMRAREAEGAGL